MTKDIFNNLGLAQELLKGFVVEKKQTTLKGIQDTMKAFKIKPKAAVMA